MLERLDRLAEEKDLFIVNFGHAGDGNIHVNIMADKAVPVQLTATIEIDGMAAGSTPARIRVAPGMHKLRLTRPGFEPVTLTINARDQLTLSPAMTMSAEGFRRWREVRAFLTGLDVVRKLTDAEAERIRGYAQMLRQSGYMVNTVEAPENKITNSIFSLGQ